MASQVESIKWVPGTSFIVDGFNFQSPRCRHYFLTHAHSDHTTGLRPDFSGGVIYVSPVTYSLLVHDMGIPPGRLRVLELNVTVVIDGVSVTPLDANHCPGAICLLFEVPTGKISGAPPTRILHTGDWRYCADIHGSHPALKGGVDVLMLDTTYLAPKWTLPPQNEAVAALAAALAEEAAAAVPQGSTLFVCSSYHIGKERAYFGAAAALGWRVWVPPAKRRVLGLLGLPSEWMSLLVGTPDDAEIHVGVDMAPEALAARVEGTAWARVVTVRPTGWSHRRSASSIVHRREDGNIVTLSVPYSEHSSYDELRAAVAALRPHRVIPTVNAETPAKARTQVDLLADVMDLSKDLSRLDAYFSAAGAAATAAAGEEMAEPTQQQREKREREVDLEAIDVEEQRRMLETFEAKRVKVETGGSEKRRSGILAYFSTAGKS